MENYEPNFRKGWTMCRNKHAIDAQRAPVHSSSCGALLRLCEAICDLCRSSCELTPAWRSRALSQDDIKLSAAAFRPVIVRFVKQVPERCPKRSR